MSRVFENLQVTVHEATRLAAANKDGTSDPFVTLKLGKSNNTKKSSIKRATLNPQWNEDFSMKLKNVKNGSINDSLEIVIFDHNQVESNTVIGRALVPLQKLAKGETSVVTHPVIHPKVQGQSGSIKVTVARIPKVLKESAVVVATRKKLIAAMRYAKLKLAQWGIDAEISVEAKVVFVKMLMKLENEQRKKTFEELELEAINALRDAQNNPLENEAENTTAVGDDQPSMFKRALDKSFERFGETLNVTKDEMQKNGLVGAVAVGINIEFADMELQIMFETKTTRRR